MAAPGSDVEELERQVERGSMFMQAIFERIDGRLSTTQAYVQELVRLLRARGVLDGEDADSDQDQPASSAAAGATSESPAGGDEAMLAGRPAMELGQRLRWPSVTLAVEAEHPAPPAPVNCAERLPICHAVCCKLAFALTAEEVEAGTARWDLGFPYLIRHGSHGSCVHNDRETGGCTIYADRPGVCRRYSCANDPRIWKDFDGMVLNQEWLDANLSAPSRIRFTRDE